MAPAAAIPVSVTWLALVIPSPATPLSGENDATVGAEGATVSTVTVSALDAALTLPAASTALLVKAWLPSTSVLVAKLQAPFAFAVEVPICFAPSNTWIVAPA
ncbi:hypothetical protein SE91_05810, partial [Bradyrhizobium sp. DOA1]